MNDLRDLDPTRTALLVMDYQPAVLARLPESERLVERAGTAVDRVRQAGGHVGWVRVGFEDADLAAIPPTSPMASVVAAPERRAAMHAEAPATQIDDRFDVCPGDIVVRKTRVGAFTTTDLAARLSDRGVDKLLLAGISSSGVVLSTVREAMDRDHRIVVLRDACADPDEGVHDFLMERIFPRHTRVASVDDLAGWRGFRSL